MHPEEQSGPLFGEQSATQRAASEWITAFCDGGSRGNPGPAGFGVYIEGPDGETLAELSEYLGKTTNNVAEYSGLLAALEFALREGRGRLRVVSDSELMVKQIQGKYKVNSPDLRPLYDEAKRRIASLERFRIEHVLRGKNQRADRLANLAMDKGTGRTPAPNGAKQNGSAAHPSRPKPTKTYKGFTKGGVIHLIEGELPDGVFVKVIPDRQ
jgi:ribonuclease HI